MTRRDLYEWGGHDRWITLVQEWVQSVCSKRGRRCAHDEPTVWSRQICAADAAARGSAGHAQHRNGGALGCDFGDDRNARRLAYHIDFTPTLLSPISSTLTPDTGRGPIEGGALGDVFVLQRWNEVFANVGYADRAADRLQE